MEIKNAKFVQSVSNGKVIPSFDAPEIAIAGKSNVGKSSFINFMVNQNKLARTSGDPGRTRLVNFFEINGGEFYFVDLPGKRQKSCARFRTSGHPPRSDKGRYADDKLSFPLQFPVLGNRDKSG